MRVLRQVLEIRDKKRYFFPGKEIRLISVVEHRKELVLYFETDATEEEILRRNKQAVGTIYIVGTGHQREDIPPDAKFIGTVVMSYGLVWHCYGKMEVSEG